MTTEPTARSQRGQVARRALAGLLLEQPPPEALAYLRQAVRAYLLGGGALPLERAIGLPTPAQLRRDQRDEVLREALKLVDGPTVNARATALHRTLRDLAERGTWRRWRGAGGIPADASEVQVLGFVVLGLGRRADAPAVPSVATIRAVARLQKKPADSANAREHDALMDTTTHDAAGQLAALLKAWSASALLRQQYRDDLAAYLRDGLKPEVEQHAAPLPPIHMGPLS